jgi:hypothetical protein
LVISRSTGIIREKILINQGYRVFRETNISARHPPVMARGMVTAV